DSGTIYQRIRNPHIDRHVREARSQFGLEVFERSEGFGKAIGLLRSGGGIGILMDQHAGDGGLWTPFFGRLASTTALPALLARRTHAKLIGFAVHTEGFARRRACFVRNHRLMSRSCFRIRCAARSKFFWRASRGALV